jgi:hypothetical protein
VQGIDQLRPSLGVQVQKPNIPTQSQLLLASQQQQILAHAQAQSNLGNSTNYGDMDPRRFVGLARGCLNSKDGQSTRNDGSICSPVQSSSPKVGNTFLISRSNFRKISIHNVHRNTLKRISVQLMLKLVSSKISA